MSGEADIIPPAISPGSAPQVGNIKAPDYRQVQDPAEVDVRHIDQDADAAGNEASRRAEELGNVFKQFEGISGDALHGLQRQAGTQAGAAAGVAGDGAPKTGLAAVTEYGDAYNAAAHVAYVNNTQVQIDSKLDQIEQDTSGDPIAFTQRAQAVGAAIVKQAPAIYQPELQTRIAQRVQAGLVRTRQQAIDTARSDAYESYTATTDSRIASALKTASALPGDQQTAIVQQTLNDNRTQLDALVKAHAITPERSAILQQKFQDSMTTAVHAQYTTNTVNHFMDFARAGDADASDRALQQYVADPANSDADKNAVTTEYLKQMDAYGRAQSRVHANDIAAVGQQLVGDDKHPGAYGPAIEGQIHSLYKQAAITPEVLHSLLDQSMRNQVSQIHDDSSNQMVDAAVHGGQKLDPTDKTVVAAADTYFKTHVALQGVPPLSDAWTAGAASFARQTNIIPPSVLSQIRIGLISGDPATAARAAAAAERIRQANPRIDPYNGDPRSATIANEITANLHAGMAPAQAYALATQTADRPKDQREIIQKNYGALLRADPNGNTKALQSALNAAVPGLFAHAPAAPVALQAEYGHLVSTYYGLNGGNIGAARALAAKQVQTTWGISRMNGAPELVKYPPERLGVSPDIIRNDVASSVKAAGYNGDPSQVHLVSNANTDGSGGRIWSLVHTDPTTGLSDVLLGKDNRPLQYHIPTGPDFAKARQALIDRNLAAARAERDEQRHNAAEQTMYEQQLSNEYLSPNSHAMMGR